jgi:hypothetical protein
MPISIDSLTNKHSGSIGFVIGAGPSLRHIDPALLTDYVTISVNSSLSKFRQSDYFVADDIGVKHWNYYQQILPKSDAVALLYYGKLKDEAGHLEPNKICWFSHKTWYEPSKKKYHDDGLIFTKQGPVIGARTTAGSAVHLAYMMGCDPIILLGCDCCYEGTKRYYWQFEGEEKCFRLNGEKVFSFPNAGMIGGKPLDSHSKDFLEYWKAVAKQTQSQGISIISASGGLLDAFPQMTLNEILDKYGERKRDNRDR